MSTKIIKAGATLDISFTLNGTDVSTAVTTETPLSTLLREGQGLTGVKIACASGVCGSCTALINGKPVTTCTAFAYQADGRNITTIEGLNQDGAPSPVQQAFMKHSAFQCGYCTPGMILLATALLAETPKPTREEAIAWMSANICRCTGYTLIIDAVMEASGQ